jgi:serine/threonine-protein kinase
MTCFGPFRFEPGNGLWRGREEVPLPPRALAVLTTLLEQPGVVVPKQTLMDAAWKDAFVTESSLLEAIRVLRDALGDDRANAIYIQTVHRRGYRFVHPITSAGAAAMASNAGAVRSDAAPSSCADALEPWRPLIVAATAAVAAIIGVAIVFALYGQRPVEPRPTMRFTIALPEDSAIDPLRGSIAVSADGARMVYVALQGGRPRLFLRTLERDEPQAIAGTDGAAAPFFSPDGQWVGFFAHGSLKKTRGDGGTPLVLCAARNGSGATWDRDGTIVFGGGPGSGLARVSADGGEPIVLVAPAPGSPDVSFGWPDAFPDGSGVLYTASTLAGSRVRALDFASGRSHDVVHAAAFGRYSPTGHVIFERRGRLEAAPFSLRERRITAAPRPILHGLATAGAPLSGPRFAFSRTGSLVYVPGAGSPADAEEKLHWLDVTGRLEPLPVPAGEVAAVEVAADLRQLAMTVQTESGSDLWVGDLHRGAITRLTSEGQSVSPTWRPNGLEIAFAYSKAGPFNLFVRSADTADGAQPLIESPWNQFPTSWSADGATLAFTEVNPLTGADIWVLDVASRQRRALVRTLFDESHARFSPDGRWVAYMSNESGRWDVFLRSVNGRGGRVQVSTAGGAWPTWSVDGRTLYFSVNGQLAAAAVRSSPALTVSAPAIMAGREDLQLASGHAAADRVLVRQSAASPARRELRVVLEWFTELARLVRLPA